MTCKHASSGCDYPAGECAGLCGHKQPKPLMLARELEGVYPVNIQDQEVAAAELRRSFQSEIEGWRHAAELDEERNRLIEELASVQAQRQAAHRSIERLQDELIKAAGIRDDLLVALNRIIEMNRITALHQFGDGEQAERWACVTVAREAIAKAVGN